MRHQAAMLVVLGVVFLASPSSDAGTLSDNFSTHPGANWCERWHHGLWDQTNLRMDMFNGTSCCHAGAGPVGCCAENCSSCGISGCVNTDIAAHSLITGFDFTGSTRSAEVLFIPSNAFTEAKGEHIALFSVQHPNCHAGFQATVFRQAITGNPSNYILKILRTSDPLTGHPECSGWTPQTSLVVNLGTLVTGTVPRYRFTLTTTQSGLTVAATATVVDTVGGATLGTVSKNFGKPSWYNQQAKRFGFGGVFGSVCIGGSTPGAVCGADVDCPGGGNCGESTTKRIRVDNFVGTY